DESDASIRAEAKLGPMPHPPLRGYYEGVYEDSVLPVIDAGLAKEIVVDGTEVVEGLSFLPSPGHSIDHACIRLSSRGEHAVLGRRDAPSAAIREARLELGILRVPRGRPKIAPMDGEPRSRNQRAGLHHPFRRVLRRSCLPRRRPAYLAFR